MTSKSVVGILSPQLCVLIEFSTVSKTNAPLWLQVGRSKGSECWLCLLCWQHNLVLGHGISPHWGARVVVSGWVVPAGNNRTHSLSSEIKLQERSWTHSYSEVAQGERCQVGWGCSYSPMWVSWLSDRVASLQLHVARSKILKVICTNT